MSSHAANPSTTLESGLAAAGAKLWIFGASVQKILLAAGEAGEKPWESWPCALFAQRAPWPVFFGSMASTLRPRCGAG